MALPPPPLARAAAAAAAAPRRPPLCHGHTQHPPTFSRILTSPEVLEANMDVLVELESNDADSSASSATARIIDLWGHDRSRETARCRWYARPADIAEDVLSTHPHADALAPNEVSNAR